jgi:CheY-like chemotaxis protein
MLLGTKPSPAATPGSDTARRGGRKAKAEAAAAEGPTLDEVLRELRALRDTQQLILEAVERLRQAVPPASSPLPLAAAAGLEEDSGPRTLSPIRDSRRRSILLVDDDPQTREAAKAELERADFPARTYDDGNAALAAIAEEKPDVIVLELGLGGDMGGTDLVNMIKATMEWVDIPVVLWTREAVAHQKEARQLYGADEVVPKSAGAAALVARVITLFRRA